MFAHITSYQEFSDIVRISDDEKDTDENSILDEKNNLRFPDADDAYARSVDPRFLIASEDLKKRSPKLVYQNFSVHLLDIGHGHCAAGDGGKFMTHNSYCLPHVCVNSIFF